jgi:threonine dehydratase
MEPIAPVPPSSIEGARSRIADAAVRTPLVPLEDETSDRRRTSIRGPSGPEEVPAQERERRPERPGQSGIWLKLECLQPIGSFKIRGAANALALAPPEELVRGIYTASAGNMAQGVAFAARRLGIECRVIVPDTAPRTKVDAIERLGAAVVPLPYDEWWSVIRAHGHPDESGSFVHPVSDPAVIAGNGTIGLEILEDLPGVDAVVVPYGGGGLSCGIASAVKAERREVRVLAAEVDTAAPFAASLEAGEAVAIERTPTFVDGIGGNSVLEEMWPLASSLLDGSLVESIDDVCDAIRTLATGTHVVAEGAGGAAVAAARSYVEEFGGRVVAVVSGGNIDADTLATILEGEVP